MADEGFNIEVGANIEKARRDVARLRDEIAKPANVPVGAGGHGPGGVAGAAPTIAGVLGATPPGFYRESDGALSRFGFGSRPDYRPDKAAVGGGQAAAVLAASPQVPWGTNMIATGGPGAWAYGKGFRGGGQSAAVMGTPSTPAGSGGGGGTTDRGMANGPWDFLPTYGGRGGAPGAFSNSFAGRGFGLTVGLGYFARIAASGAIAGRQAGIDAYLAGNDQRALAESSLRQRDAILGSVPILGDVIRYASDPTGVGEAGVRTTLAAATAQDAYGESLQRSGRASMLLRGQFEVAAASGSYRKRLAGSVAGEREALAGIEERGRAEGLLENASIQAQRVATQAELDRTRAARIAARVTPGVPVLQANGTYAMGADNSAVVSAAIAAEDAATLAGIGSGLSAKRDLRIAGDKSLVSGTYARERGEIERDESLRRSMSIAGYGASARESLAEMAGGAAAVRESREASANAAAFANLNAQRIQGNVGPAEYFAGVGALAAGALSQVMLRGREQYQIQRQRDYEIEDARGRGDTTQYLIGRNPLGASINAINEQERQALRNVTDDGRKNELMREFRLQRVDLIRQDSDQRSLVLKSLANQGGQLDAALKGGVYGGVIAGARASRDAALLQVQRLQQENGSGINNPIILATLQNAAKEQDLIQKQFFNQFRPTEISPNRSDTSGGGPAGGLGQVVGAIAELKAALVTEIRNIPFNAQ